MEKYYLVTSALPYPNGPMHIGHISSTYLPADVYSRFCRLMGRKVINLWGTDDHGVAIEIAAKKQGISEDEIVQKYNHEYLALFEQLWIDCDIFSRTHHPIHQALAQEIFQKVQANGYLEKRDEDQMYCTDCETFLPDRYIEGTCPHCGEAGARGDQCEKCWRMLNPTALRDAYCTICKGKNLEKKHTYNYYFLLSKLQNRLEERLATKTHRKPNVLGVVKKRMQEGLQDRCVTRDIKRWIPVPWDEQKKMYVRFEACFGYLSFVKQYAQEHNKPDLFENIRKSTDSHTVHFIGKDNIVFHTIIWPALIMAYDGGFKLPDDIPAFEFLNLEGQKISTSRNHAIWLHDIIKSYPADVIRYYMTWVMPETKDADFKRNEFMERNNELANTLGNLVNRTLAFATKNFDGKLKWILGENLTQVDTEILAEIESIRQNFITHLDNYKFKDAINIVFEYLRNLNKYFNDRAPRVLAKQDKASAELVMSITAIGILSAWLLFSPFMPHTAQKIFTGFGLNIQDFSFANIGDIAQTKEFIISDIGYLFTRIEQDDIAKEIEKLTPKS